MISEKEYYQLWWEYLKRGDNYQKIKKLQTKVDRTLTLPDFPGSKDRQGFYRLSKDGENLYQFHRMYREFIGPFGDRDLNFDLHWRAVVEKRRPIFMKWARKRLVQNYITFAETNIQSIIDHFKVIEGREPTLQEFKESYINDIFNSQLFIIDPVFNKKNQLIEEVANALKNKIEKQIDTRIRDELKRYLKVYDLWKETDEKGKRQFTMKDIVKEIGTKAQKENAGDADTLRAFRSDLAKAKKIIKNVERGIFPGKYY